MMNASQFCENVMCQLLIYMENESRNFINVVNVMENESRNSLMKYIWQMKVD